MTALPIEPTERDRERFRDITKAMGFALEYNRRLAANGDYTYPQTVAMFQLWWAQERERQMLQNLNQSQGVKLTEWENKYAVLANEYQSTCAAANDTLERMEKSEAELARLREQKPVAYVKYKQTGGNVGLSWVAIPTGEFYPREMDALYAAPVPAAPAVPDEWRDMLAWLIGQRGKAGHCHNRPGIWDDDNGELAGKPCHQCAMYDKARALLQSATQADKEA